MPRSHPNTHTVSRKNVKIVSFFPPSALSPAIPCLGRLRDKRRPWLWWTRSTGIRRPPPRTSYSALKVKASGCGSDDEEELEWLSNKDAFPTVETMDSAGARPRPRKKGVRQSRAVVAWSAAARRQCRHCGTKSTPQWREGPMGRRTLCNACGIKYRAGRLLPEYRPAKSPTFSSELHSNRHDRIVELRRLRGETVQTSLAAAGYGKEGGQELERLSNKSVFLAVDTMAPAGQRPRTKGLQRPRRVLAWSPPPPPRTPVQGRVPGGGGADGGRAAAPAGGGVEAIAPWALAVAGPRRSQGGRDGMAIEQRRVPGGGDDGVGGDAATDEGRAVGQRLNQPGPGGGEMALDQGLRVPFVGDNCTAGGGAADKGRPAAAAAPSGGGVDHAARAAALQTPASAVAQRWCQHCGTEKTPRWREGPDGRRTLCNACGQRYKKGGLVPEYRPASSPTFSPTRHSNHRRILQQLRASPVVTTATAAVFDAGDK
ncbi:uncharacterized protein LOC8070522 isoform X1 [Sorghum bicolor]|nr:uncharacterized protein LOC8070522 isoform X1 [Sorghum bicolor]|eukprot:XP_021315680.1 uncharacterized protein LOC8070522 isoform X1 [Sorghum bicolor]